MAYTNPTTQATDHIVTATEWNTDLVDNIRALKNPPSAHFEANEATDYSTTSTTWTSVDATSGKFSLSITTTGGDVMVGFSGVVTKSTDGAVFFDVQLDGGSHIGGDDGLAALWNSSGRGTVTFLRLVPLAAGVHTFTLRWKVTGTNPAVIYAGAGTAGLDLHPQFWARELS
jgi:hypothetical protein